MCCTTRTPSLVIGSFSVMALASINSFANRTMSLTFAASGLIASIGTRSVHRIGTAHSLNRNNCNGPSQNDDNTSPQVSAPIDHQRQCQPQNCKYTVLPSCQHRLGLFRPSNMRIPPSCKQPRPTLFVAQS